MTQVTAPPRKVQLQDLPIKPGMTRECVPACGRPRDAPLPTNPARFQRRPEAPFPPASRQRGGVLPDVSDHLENERSGILLDMYFNALAYASKQGLTMEKTSCLLAILKAVHEKAKMS